MPITARLVAKLVGVSGADRALLLDLHAGQIQGFFDVPVDEMSAMSLTASYFAQKRLPDRSSSRPTWATPSGRATSPRSSMRRWRSSRSGGPATRTEPEVLNLIGSVEGKQAIIVDDEIDTAGSITQAAQVCLDAGATEVYASAIHPVLSGPAVERLQASPIREVVVTQQHRRPAREADSEATVLSVARCSARRSSASTPAPASPRPTAPRKRWR